jgi:hypothetical protein
MPDVSTYPCTVRDRRATMTEEEFWTDVAETEAAARGYVPPDDDGPDLDDVTPDLGACRVCGEPGACGYDAEGRPMIHTTTEEE